MKKIKITLLFFFTSFFALQAQFLQVKYDNFEPCEGETVKVYMLGQNEDVFFQGCSDDNGYTGPRYYEYTVEYATGNYSAVQPIGSLTLSDTLEITPQPNNWINPGLLKVIVKGYRKLNGDFEECPVAITSINLKPLKVFPSISGPNEINNPGDITYTVGSQINNIPGITWQWTVPSQWQIQGQGDETTLIVTPADQDGTVSLVTSPAVTACNYPPKIQVEVTDCFTNGQTVHAFCESNTWSNAFPTSGYGSQDKWPRMIGDFNGDDKDDVIGFGHTQVVVGLSTGSSFDHSSWSSGFVYGNSGATQKDYPRMIGDFSGDGMDDIIVFGHNETHVGVSDGSSFSTAPFTIFNGFTYSQGYTNRNVVQRMIGDFNGDGKDDVVGFGYNYHDVALSSGNSFSTNNWIDGTAFTAQSAGMNDYNKFPKLIGDFDGDGKDDVVGFGYHDVTVGLSNGSKFIPTTWANGFGYSQGFEQRKYPRMVGDFDGDGNDDIIAFGHTGITVGISTNGNSFVASNWLSGEEFTHASGWNIDGREIGIVDESDFGDAFPNNAELHEIRIADANGDGKDDIIGFYTDKIYVSYSTGTAFMCPDEYEAFSNNVGYEAPKYIRTVGNFDNTNDRVEIIGFGFTSTQVMNCNSCTGAIAGAEFIEPDHMLPELTPSGKAIHVHHYCDAEEIILDLSGTSCEDRYFVEIHEYNLGNGSIINTVYNSGWIYNNAPDILDITMLHNFQTNKLYNIRYGVGPGTNVKNLWLRISELDARMTLNAPESRFHQTKYGLGVKVDGYCSNVSSIPVFASHSTCYSEYRFEMIEVMNGNLVPIGLPIYQYPSQGGYESGTIPNVWQVNGSSMQVGKLYRLRLYVKEGNNIDIATRFVEEVICTGKVQDSNPFKNTYEVSNPDLIASTIYPNPTVTDEISLEVSDYGDEGATASIYTISGEIIKTFKVSSHETVQVDLENMMSGLYYIRIEGAQRNETIRLVKK